MKIWLVVLAVYFSDGTLKQTVMIPPSPESNNQETCETAADNIKAVVENAPEVVKATVGCAHVDVTPFLGQPS